MDFLVDGDDLAVYCSNFTSSSSSSTSSASSLSSSSCDDYANANHFHQLFMGFPSLQPPMEGVVEQQQQFRAPPSLLSSSHNPNSNNNCTSSSNESINSGGGDASSCTMLSSCAGSVDGQSQLQQHVQFVQQQHQQQCSPPALLHEQQRRQSLTMAHNDMNTLMECDDEGGIDGCDQRQKRCRVCGDSATGYNFNVISCESCKAFFRRNALRPKEFKCPYANECEITSISRRFCQKCRLRKCFDVGMKKEWILSEDQLKRRKNARIKCQQHQLQHPNDGGIGSKEVQHHQQQHNHSMQQHYHSSASMDQQQLTPTTTTPVSSVASSVATTGGAAHTPGSVGSVTGGGGGGGTPNCFESSSQLQQQPSLPPSATLSASAIANSNSSNNNTFSPPQNLLYPNCNTAIGTAGMPHQQHSLLNSILNHNSTNASGASPLALAALSALIAGASPGGQLSTAENSPLGSAIAALGNSPRGGGAVSALSCFDANKVSPCSMGGVQSPPPILPIIDPNQQRQFLTQQQQQLLLQTVLNGAAAAATAAATTGGNAATLANAAVALARSGHTQQAVAALQQFQQQVAEQQQNNTNSNSAGLSPLIIDQCHRLMMLGQQQQQQQHQHYGATVGSQGSSPKMASPIKAEAAPATTTVPSGVFYHHQQQQVSPGNATTPTTVVSTTASYGIGAGGGAVDALGSGSGSACDRLPPATTPSSIGAAAAAGGMASASSMMAHFQRMSSRQQSEAIKRHIQNTIQDELNVARSPPADSSSSPSRKTPTSGVGTVPMPSFIASPYQSAGGGDRHRAISETCHGTGTVPTTASSSASSTASSPLSMGTTVVGAVPSMLFKDLRAFQLNSLEARDVDTVKAAFSLMDDELRKNGSNMMRTFSCVDDLMMLLETMLRRMVQVIKKLPTFNELSHNGRFALLKGAIIDMLTVRGALSVDVKNECWKRPLVSSSSSEIRLNFNILDHLLDGSMQTQRVMGFYKELHGTLMKDSVANNLVILIIMFNHHRDTDLSAEDKPTALKHLATYTELLKRYLESIYGPEEARQIYETVPKAFVTLNVVTEKAKELFRARVPTEDEKMLKHIKLAAEIFPTEAVENGTGKEREKRQEQKGGGDGTKRQQQRHGEESSKSGSTPATTPTANAKAAMMVVVKQEQE